MSQPEQFDILVLGSGAGGKLLAWHMAREGRRTAVVERRWIGGSCPNINCMPSKNEIWSAKVAHLVHQAAQFGLVTGPVAVDMATVRQRKRAMVDGQIARHLQNYKTSGAALIMGTGHFVAPKTLEVCLNDGGTRLLAGDQVFLNVGTHAAMPRVPGLEAARPLTNIEALELDYVPPHLIVLGGGYVGLELGQAYRRFGSRVIERGPQLMSREDPDVSEEVQRILSDQGIHFFVEAEVLHVHGRSGNKVSLVVRTTAGERHIEGSDILVAAGRTPNTAGIGLEVAGVQTGWSGLHSCQRAAQDECRRGLGDRGMRWESPVHARSGRRLSDHQGQSGRGEAQHAGSAGSVLHVHGASTRPRRTDRRRCAAPRRPRAGAETADERCPADGDDRWNARVHEGSCRW